MTSTRGTCRCCSTASSSCSPRPSTGRDAVVVDARSASAATPTPCSPPTRGCAWSALDRDPDALALVRRTPRPPRRPGRTSCTPSTTSCRRRSPTSASRPCTASCSTSASPRCSWTWPSAASPTRKDAPLDMRMDPTTGLTAADVLNTYAGRDLTRILRDYGEERFAQPDRQVGRGRTREGAVHHQRRLVELLYDAVPGGHAGAPAGTRPSAPSRRCGSRSTANWTCCAAAMPGRAGRAAVGGRIVVESYQSLEDRIVKRALAELARSAHPAGPAGGAARARPASCGC